MISNKKTILFEGIIYTIGEDGKAFKTKDRDISAHHVTPTEAARMLLAIETLREESRGHRLAAEAAGKLWQAASKLAREQYEQIQNLVKINQNANRDRYARVRRHASSNRSNPGEYIQDGMAMIHMGEYHPTM